MTLIGISVVIWYRIPTGWFEFNWMVLRVWNTLSRTMEIVIIWNIGGIWVSSDTGNSGLCSVWILEWSLDNGQEENNIVPNFNLPSSYLEVEFWHFGILYSIFGLGNHQMSSCFLFPGLAPHLFSYLTVVFLMPQNKVRKKAHMETKQNNNYN